MNPLRICFVCDEYPPGPHGGIGSFVQMLARGLVAAGHEVKVVGLYHDDYPAADYEEDQGVQVWRLRRRRGHFDWIRGRYKVFRKICKWSRDRQIDLVEVVDYGGPAALWPKLRVPVVTRLHGSATYFSGELNESVPRTFYRLEKASLHRADFCCSVSRYTAQKTKEVFGLSFLPDTVLYNFIDSTNNGNGQRRDNQDVVFSGTLTYKKGVVPLIQAWPHVLAKREHAILHIYGKDGRTDSGKSMKEMLSSQLEPCQQETVEFHGHTDRQELLAALSEARVGVFPSYAESFGLAPAESMAAACPTIYSERGCGGELVRDGKDGLLIDPDQPEQIAAAIVRLLEDDRLAKQLGASGQARIRENFSLDAQLPRNIAFYRECIQRKSAGETAKSSTSRVSMDP